MKCIFFLFSPTCRTHHFLVWHSQLDRRQNTRNALSRVNQSSQRRRDHQIKLFADDNKCTYLYLFSFSGKRIQWQQTRPRYTLIYSVITSHRVWCSQLVWLHRCATRFICRYSAVRALDRQSINQGRSIMTARGGMICNCNSAMYNLAEELKVFFFFCSTLFVLERPWA